MHTVIVSNRYKAVVTPCCHWDREAPSLELKAPVADRNQYWALGRSVCVNHRADFQDLGAKLGCLCR